jgi:ABC-type multidrug transport system ATPase subunit/ABC-type multidrug transport system permease subunit
MQTEFLLDSREIVLGRDVLCDIVLPGVGVSGRHARIILDPQRPAIYDCESTFGTFINGNPVARYNLMSGDILTVGIYDFTITIEKGRLCLRRGGTNITFAPVPEKSTNNDTAITLGRDTSNTIHLSHPLISRHHCTFRRDAADTYSVKDHGSTNGTYINGKRVDHSVLGEGDIIQVGPYRFVLESGQFIFAEDSSRIRLAASSISVFRGSIQTVKNISLMIPPGEFVAILGPSGAGKTTLALALAGQIPVSGGDVYYNGLPLRKFLGAFATSIGYVSQQNLLRPELTVWETMTEQSMVRLPRDSLMAERRERIREVLEMLDITSLKNRRIAELSGGEAKRVHVGVELLSSPTVIFLDEPLAGLDPGLVHRFMELFRQLADKGHTLLLTTHTLEQLDLCDRMLFVNQGRLFFDGPPRDAIIRFGVPSLAALYEKIRVNPAAINPATSVKPAVEGDMADQKALPPVNNSYRKKPIHPVRQLALLISRYAKIVWRDTKNLMLIVVQAPMIALLLGLVFDRTTTFVPLSFYFCLTIASVWMGGVNTVREFAREWPHFNREYRIGLSVIAYVGAKIILFSTVGFLQTILFGFTLHAAFPPFVLSFNALIVLCAASFSGVILGLCISAFSAKTSQAVSWLPIVFIPQIFFSGILMPFDQMAQVGQWLSYATVSRAIFSIFKKAFILAQPLQSLKDWYWLILINVVLIILMFCIVKRHGATARPDA